VAESEGILLIVPVFDLVILLFEDFESEVVLLFSTEAKSLRVHVSLESLMKLMNLLPLLMEAEAEHGGCL
jgi:hypothetical protein